MVTSLALWRVLIYLFAVKMTLAKRKTIDIFNDGKGDILQLRTIQRLRYNSIGNKYRNAIFNNSQRKWNVKDAKGNTVIPYVVTGRYDYEELKVIKQAMERIQKNTCIRFRWKHHEVDYIDIQNKRNEGCIEVQIVQHELLHAIGLWHEHMRYDRDRYIKVLYENIRPGYEDQFQKVPQRISTVYGLPYDYKSVMHYGKSAFALPGRISMLTLDAKYTNVIGQQLDASPLDYEKVCKIYGCSHCNGEGENPDGGDETPHPTPKPQPPSPIPKSNFIRTALAQTLEEKKLQQKP
ncbi:astacin [Dictyocaulus viviparus]|uniref:Metalloendopeptidase n=1 Tax=Dictyocaulus viviparus TaxID=29172 RepID=A0A0D8XMN7_DICVI|nr:astacin [Dictyocaulus viviparus]